MERILTYKVDDEYAEKNIKTLLKQHFKMSSVLISSLKKYDDGICVNGEKKYVNHILNHGDTVTITIHESFSENIEPVEMALDIVYEDEDLIILNKPPHMPTHPSMGHRENTLANGLMYYFASQGEKRVFRAVNRLDKDTSGLMAVAKNGYTHARLGYEIQTKELRRKYTAIVCGDLDKSGTVDAPITRADGSVINRIVAEDGQRAVTHYRVLKRFGDYTLLELELETGRTHQIRVHMAHIGHPLLGDWLYGEENHDLFPRQALHSCYISLIQPVTGEKLEFKSDIAEDMKNFVEKFDKTIEI
jgi:23S rRNA pseudouridine1911/1915/1917 synthase